MEAASFSVLHEIKAGRLLREGTTLRADTRKGLIRVVKREDGLVSFQWRERSATHPDVAPETEIILFPQDATFIKIPGSTSRTFMLKFSQSERDLFFWMQEPKAENDAQHAMSISTSISSFSQDEDDDDPAMETEEEASPAGGLVDDAPQDMDDQARIQASQLAQALRSIGLPAGTQQGEAGMAELLAAMQQQREQPAGPSLSEVLKPEVLLPMLRDPTILQSLAEHLPEGQRTQSDLEKLVTSAQLRHQLDVFSSALRSGQLDLAHFELEGQGSSVLDFLRGIQKRFSQPESK